MKSLDILVDRMIQVRKTFEPLAEVGAGAGTKMLTISIGECEIDGRKYSVAKKIPMGNASHRFDYKTRLISDLAFINRFSYLMNGINGQDYPDELPQFYGLT